MEIYKYTYIYICVYIAFIARFANSDEDTPMNLEELQGLATSASRLDLRGINHLALVSSNMLRTTRFVTEKLGIQGNSGEGRPCLGGHIAEQTPGRASNGL